MHVIFAVFIIAILFAEATVHDRKYFFIYDWPESSAMSDVWPPLGSILDEESPYDHGFSDNNGAGKILDGANGLFQTWQFSLFKNIMSRLYLSKYRTRDPNKAVAFIIPFDAGVHSYIDQNTGKRRLGSPHAWSVIRWLQESQKNNLLWKNNGHDHFVLFSLTEFVMTGIGVKEFFMGICQNCTALTIEASPTKTSTPYHRSQKYWYPVPYPSSYHWWEGIRVQSYPWSIKSVTDASYRPREILALFIGSMKTNNKNSNMLRRSLHFQCTSHASCHWYNTAHACNGVVNATHQMQLFQRSRFCLAPPGDSVTRKSLFDALVAGCVPVIFARASLSQYSWFLSAKEVADVAVYISKTSILDGSVNFLDVLNGISDADLLAKQRVMETVAPRLQYSVVPKRMVHAATTAYIRDICPDSPTCQSLNQTSNDNVFLLASGNNRVLEPYVEWEPPFEDATSIIIQRILDRRTIEPVHGFSEAELSRLNCLQHELMLRHPDYAGLFHGTQHLTRGRNSQRAWAMLNCESVNFTTIS